MANDPVQNNNPSTHAMNVIAVRQKQGRTLIAQPPPSSMDADTTSRVRDRAANRGEYGSRHRRADAPLPPRTDHWTAHCRIQAGRILRSHTRGQNKRLCPQS